MDTEDLLIGEGDGVVSAVIQTVFGTEREAHVCPACEVACEPTTTYDPARAAFDGGASPAWECGECGREFVREQGDETYALDLYGRDPPE